MRGTPLPLGILLFSALLAAGCGGGGGVQPSPEPIVEPVEPTLEILTPDAYLVVPLALGGTVEITYVDDDPDSDATTDIVADRDGDLSTTEDQIVIGADLPDGNGAEQSIGWTVDGEPFGIYHILGRTADDEFEVFSNAPGLVELNAPPLFQMGRPLEDTLTCRAGIARISCASKDPDDTPFDTLLLDGDADLSTATDQHTLFHRLPGGEARDEWMRLWDVPVGTYAVMGLTDDDVNPPVADTARGELTVRNVGWAGHLGGAGAEDAFGAALFADGSWVATGTFWDPATFGEGDPQETTLQPAGANDVFVARYASDGTLQWARSDGGPSGDYASDIAVCGDEDCVVVGYFSGDATFGDGEANETTLTSVGQADPYVARYDPSGSLRWVAHVPGPDFGEARTVTALPDGGCVVAGSYAGTPTFGAGESNETVLVASGVYDVFVARYDAEGRLAWARSAGSLGLDQAWGTAAFPDGSCAICGNVGAAATFGAGEPAQTILTTRGGLDMFVARYSATGDLLWARAGGGPAWDSATGVAAGPGDSCIVTGSFDGTAIFDAGPGGTRTITGEGNRDGYAAHYASDGALQWVRAIGGSEYEGAEDVAAFPDGTFVVTGSFYGETRLGDGEANETTLVAVGTRDAFVACFHQDGSLAWAWACGSTGLEVGRAIAGGSDGSGLVVGSFQDSMIVGEGWPHETLLMSYGASDGFLIRFNGDGGL